MNPFVRLGKNNRLTITEKRFQEVADHINDSFGTIFTKEQIMNSDLPITLLLEIADNGYTATCQRGLIIDHLSNKYVGRDFPCYGDSNDIKKQFNQKAKENGII